MEIIFAFIGGMFWSAALQPPLEPKAVTKKWHTQSARIVMRNGMVYETRPQEEKR